MGIEVIVSLSHLNKTRGLPGVGGGKWGILGVMFNKTFYSFLFSFVAVVAGTLIFILVVGMGVA